MNLSRMSKPQWHQIYLGDAVQFDFAEFTVDCVNFQFNFFKIYTCNELICCRDVLFILKFILQFKSTKCFLLVLDLDSGR